MSGKLCSICCVTKTYEEFSRHCRSKDGRRGQCKMCLKNKELNKSEEELVRIKKVRNNYYLKNKDKKKQYRINNLEKIKSTRKLYNANNKTKISEYGRKYRESNSDKAKNYFKTYYKNNKVKLIQYQKEYNKNNKEFVLNRSYGYIKNKRSINPSFKIRTNMSGAIFRGLRKKKFGKGWQTLVPYTVQELMSHLESKFTDGMTWENYGRNGWHIDHIIPQSLFKYDSYDHPAFKACWALENLQPLWAKDNYGKNNKIKLTTKVKKFLKSVNEKK